jgi:hypothetical protein
MFWDGVWFLSKMLRWEGLNKHNTEVQMPLGLGFSQENSLNIPKKTFLSFW